MDHNLIKERDLIHKDRKYYLNDIQIWCRDYLIFKCPACSRQQRSIVYSFKSIICGPCQSSASRSIKYGSKTYNNRDKAKNTNLEKFGVDNPAKSEQSKLKVRSTNLEKYGHECSLHGINHEKTLKTINDKYGSNCSLNNPEIIKRVKDALKEKYGVSHISHVEEFRIKQQSNRAKKWRLKLYESDFGPIYYQTILELNFIKFCEKFKIFVKNGPRISYLFENKEHMYFVDFETNNHLVEIKGSHFWYFKDLKNGLNLIKNSCAEKWCKDNNKTFLFILDKKNEEEFKEIFKNSIS